MKQFWTNVMNFFKHASVWVSKEFVAVFGSQIAHNFAVAAEGILNTELGRLAMQFVGDAATAIGISGAEKKLKAFTNIAAAAKDAGIEASDSLINLVIEAAVQKVSKNSFGPAIMPNDEPPTPPVQAGDTSEAPATA